jgi:hypothetical protein
MRTLLTSLALLASGSAVLAQEYDLVYRFQPGEEIRTQVVHVVTVETKIKGVLQTAKTHSVSTRVWKIVGVDRQGNITLENSVAAVNMSQSHTGEKGTAEVRFNSQTDAEPPQEYASVPAMLGKTLATITIDRAGKIIDRKSDHPNFNPGIGDLTVPLPGRKVKVGDTWHTPEEIRLRADDGTVKRIPTRQLYRLEKVESGVATISVITQVLTPVNDPKLQSQLVQRLQKGTVKFDVDAGRLIRRQMDLDESVFGFAGDDSHMQYLARLTEEPLPASSASSGGGIKR